MHTEQSFVNALAVMIVAAAAAAALKRLTGHSLDELDELNYQRVMADGTG